MTLEHRVLFELTDIVAVTFECTECLTRLTLKRDALEAERLHACPKCNAEWLNRVNDHAPERHPAKTHLYSLLRALRGITSSGEGHCRVFLECEQGDQPKGSKS